MKREFLSPLLGTLTFGVSLLSATPSQAQAFYEGGEVSVALERAFGIHYWHGSRDYDAPRADDDYSATTVGVGWAGAQSRYHHGRAAVDGFITDRLSLGGALGFYSQSGDADENGFIFSPRIGYAVPISAAFTFWPRGGLTYFTVGEANQLALSGEAMFVATPRPGWGILFGVTLDFGFAGEAENDVDWTETAIGFPSVGLMGTF